MAEFLDVYDANRKLIGPCDRLVVHTFGLWHRTVHCYVVWNGKIVFSQRSAKKSNPNKLYSTVSGHLLSGESIEAALRRELGEEIGLDASNLVMKKLDESVWIADMKKADGSTSVDRVFYSLFMCELSDIKKIGFTDGEVDRVVAIDLNEFLKWSKSGGRDGVPAGTIAGTEWNGSTVKDVVISTGDFVVNEGEAIYTKYGLVAEMIQDVICDK